MMKAELEKSKFIGHQPCEKCGSSDAKAMYEDGHAYCFKCNTYYHGKGEKILMPELALIKNQIEAFIDGEVVDLTKRKISKETCAKWDYRVGAFGGFPVQIANYKGDDNKVVAQKIRYPNKDFRIIGNSKAMGLYGQHLWRESGKMVVVTEGEIDALSLSHIQGNKWPVVSVPNGASAAPTAIQKAIDWLERFEVVVFMFDSDEAGRKAASICAGLLSPGKAKIASLPLKDINDMLVAGREAEVIDAVWSAKTFRPDGIVAGTDLWETIRKVDQVSAIQYPFSGLTRFTHGLRKGELITITAGSGVGKSQFCRELANWLLKNNQKVGYIALEESVRRTALGILGIEMSLPLHLNTQGVSEDDLRKTFDSTVGSGKFFTYDHFGSIDSDNLINRIRYLVRACECDFIFLDHLSIVVSGMEGGDERRLIDNTMTRLRSLVEELKMGLILVSHLKRPEGRGHEEGAATSLSQLRGSAGIAQLSDMVIGLERNQQGDPSERLNTYVRVLKNRWSGETGLCSTLEYNPATGRLLERATPDIQVPREIEDL
jgi:twinkle protein